MTRDPADFRSHGSQATAQRRDPQVRAAADAAADGAAVDDRVPARHDRRADGRAGEPRAAPRATRSRADRRTGRRQRRPRRADRPAASSSGASASRRACTSASICPATRCRSRCRDCGASSIEAIEQTEPYPIARIKPAQETPADPAELDDLVARVVVGRRDAGRAGRPNSGRGAGDPQDERLRSGPVRRPRGDEHELPDLRQGRGAAAPRRRPAPALHPRRASSAKSRARA